MTTDHTHSYMALGGRLGRQRERGAGGLSGRGRGGEAPRFLLLDEGGESLYVCVHVCDV